MAQEIKEAVESGEVIETLKRVAQESPDRVDRNAGNAACLYFDGDTGERCIVGQVFHEYGVSDTILARTRGAVAAALHTLTGDREGGFYESLSFLYLTAAQSAQDAGLPWGLAWEYAEASVNEDLRRLDLTVDAWVEQQDEDFPWVRTLSKLGVPAHFVKLTEAELPA